MVQGTRIRMTATERGTQVLAAAVQAFAESGYAATKTDEIARRAGVSQPYVIRLFGTKQQLFVAAIHQVCDRIEQIFRISAEEIEPGADPQSALQTLGSGFTLFLADRDLLLVLLHAISAANSDPVIGEEIRQRYGQLYDLVFELTGAPATDRRQFFATGMLLTIMTSMRVAGPEAISVPWAAEMLDDLTSVGH